MKKQFYTFVLLIFTATFALGQVKIHSHNDYTHKQPFVDAIKNKAFSIEADVFVVGDSLMVAHTRSEIQTGNTLKKMYLKPIEAFSKSKEFYSFQLMIDVKEHWELTYPILLKLLKPYQKTFLSGEKKVTIAISGTRPPDSTFHSYPAFINFDGLPDVNYASKDLKKVTMISDDFATYSNWDGLGKISDTDKRRLKVLTDNAHKIGKPFRFWGAPDTKACWKMLHEIGADIINTDKVSEATKFFKIEN